MVMIESIENPLLGKLKGDAYVLKHADYLLSVNGTPVTGHEQGNTLLAKACGTLDLEVIRDRKALMCSITRAPDTKVNLSSGGEMVIVRRLDESGRVFGMVHEDDEALDAWMRCDCVRKSKFYAAPTNSNCAECKRFLMSMNWMPAPKGKAQLAMELGLPGRHRRRSLNDTEYGGNDGMQVSASAPRLQRR